MRSAATAKAPGSTATPVATAPLWILFGILAAGLVVRLVFLPADGFSNDVSTFESWSLTLNHYGPRGFYAHAGFADYPPGYFFVLWLVGHVYATLTAIHPDPDYSLLKALVKLPAIVMDLTCASLIYAIVKRYATDVAALVAAAILAFNPSVVFISAYWGQVDSVAAGFTLVAVFCLMKAYDATPATETRWIVLAWAALAYSILIKPPAAILVFLFLAFVFVNGATVARRRAIATAYGIAAALAIAFLAAVIFNAGPGLNPVGQFVWLFQRYAYASSVYPYDSVNAFNLYAVFLKFWQPDTELLPKLQLAGHTIGLTRNVWGILLLGVAIVLVVSRFVQRKDAPALLEAAMVLSLGFFVLSTRMHERYVFTALALAVPLAVYRRRYLYATFALTFTLFVNLVYSLIYLKAVSNQMPGVDASDIMPAISRPLAALNVLTFFYLGYVYLGSAAAETMEDDRLARLGTTLALAGRTVRGWFSPIEGVARMTPRDWQISVSLTLASFALSFVNYWWPSEKIFDEIYYARAGEEYLTHANVNGFGVFEFTHPPLTKLVITLSMVFFGGMPHGDWAGGWRFLNVVVGALMVLVCYAFAKRMLASTLFASLAAGFLLFDGFHFVQSRIATPEITVAFFALTTLYCFYRFWIASQVRVFPQMRAPLARRELSWLAGGSALALGLALLCTQVGAHQTARATALAFVYFELGIYLAVRLLVPRFDGAGRTAPEASFADGSRVVAGRRIPPDGVEPAGARPGAGFAFARPDLRVEYAAGDGPVTYRTPDGEAVFAAEAAGTATMHVDFAGDLTRGMAAISQTLRGDSPQKWMFVLAVSAGCLASSKWNGLFDFFVVWICALLVVSQPYWTWIATALRFGNTERESGGGGPTTWGNPFGISIDILVAAMLFVSMTIYALCYVPFFALGKNLEDLIGLQQQMYWYHANLKATHPYGSSWWQWPILQRPISYYYHDFRSGAATQDPNACCVAEILALPNPLIWWTGLVSVPYIAYLAWRERHKGFTLLVGAYFLQWLPWIISPRVAFEYHFFPNLAIICIADAALLQRVWQLGYARVAGANAEARGGLAFETTVWPRYAVYGYAVLAVLVFAFFYPVTAGMHVRWYEWDARMLHWLEGVHWI